MKKALSAGLTMMFIAGLLGPSTSAASTISLNGVVHCSGSPVEGVWVQSSGGGSKFAGWRPFNTGTSDAAYSTTLATALPSAIQLRVGCGGSKAKWTTTNYSPNRTVRGSTVLNAFCDAHGHCVWPAKGNTTTRNLGYHLQCTEGALNQWYAYTGFWPLWSGNAAVWSTTAAQNRYTVTTVAMPKSIVVFPATKTNSAGHVAWVDSISQSSSGAITLNVIEENFDGTASHPTGHVRRWAYAANPSYRYIPTP